MVDLAFAAAHTLIPATFLVLWAASVGWTLADARRRCDDPRRVRLAVGLAAALPVGGAVLYALARPCEPSGEDHARLIWRRFLEAQLEPGERCLACLTPLEPEFRCCPGCGDDLRTECLECGSLLRIGWAACPHCLTPVVAPRRLEPVAA